jgi:hypothetical protein
MDSGKRPSRCWDGPISKLRVDVAARGCLRAPPLYISISFIPDLHPVATGSSLCPFNPSSPRQSHSREISGRKPTPTATKVRTGSSEKKEDLVVTMKSTSSQSVVRRAMTSIALVAFVVLAVFTFMPVGAKAELQEKDNDFGTVIGIDLGTTYSCVA